MAEICVQPVRKPIALEPLPFDLVALEAFRERLVTPSVGHFSNATLHPGGDLTGPSVTSSNLGPYSPFDVLSPRTIERARGVEIPNYDRGAVSVGHVHLGPGNFFKALIAPIVDAGMRAHRSGWESTGICTVSFRKDPDRLRAQDGLYTVLEKTAQEGDVERARIIGAVKECLYLQDHREAVLRRMADPQVSLITMTITRDGYCIDGDSELDVSHADIDHDLQFPESPRSAVGVIVEACRRRMNDRIPPFHVMSCDNIVGNGDVLHSVVLNFIGRITEAQPTDGAKEPYRRLADWVRNNVQFPNTTVDRITPKTTKEHLREIHERIGILDREGIFTEPECQWVIDEAPFGGTRLPWMTEKGVLLAPDAVPYSRMKVRVLNGTHMLIAWFGTRMGIETVQDVLEVPGMKEFVKATILEELAPTLPAIPGQPPELYSNWILDRLGNRGLPDTIGRLNNDGTTKIPDRILTPICEALDRNISFSRLALVVAAWMLSQKGFTHDGERVLNLPVDNAQMLPQLDAVAASAQTPEEIVDGFLKMHCNGAPQKPLFGKLASDSGFRKCLLNAVTILGSNRIGDIVENPKIVTLL